MSTENSDNGPSITLSLVAQFDDINRLNGVLNDGYSEECFLAFVKQMEWVRTQWAAAESEAVRLQTELDEALRALAKWEAKFAHVRKMLDGEKRERNIVLKKYNDLNRQLDMARDLLFNDNRTKLNDETLQKLAFLNGTAQQEHNARLAGVPELNSTGTLLSDISYSRSEEDLDLSLASTRRSWVQRGAWAARESQPATKKRRSSTNSSATKTVELQGGKVLATATTTLTLERAPAHDLKPPQNFQPISESSDEAPPRKSSQRLSGKAKDTLHAEYTPSAPPRTTESESASETPRAAPQRTQSVLSAAFGSPRTRPRLHNFVAKNFYKRETCGPCGKTMKFATKGVKCETCRAQAHPECRELLPLPCVPPGATLRRNNNAATEGSIADFAPSTPPMVPALLVHCINEVEKRGLSERGIYRISAVEKDVKRLKERFLRGCGSPQLGNEDIHVLCGCIKDFLRSLREPLVSNALWTDFMEAARLSEPNDATAAVIQAVSQLPQPNRDTLAFLVLHLQKVAESPECEMGIENLAKIFGPTVVGYGLMTQAAEMYSATAQMFNVMQVLLRLPADYWAQWACPGDPSPRAQRPSHRPQGYFFSPVTSGLPKKKRNYF